MSGYAFHDDGSLERTAFNLFYLWGYNFYRLENQLRADDLLIRGKVGELLGSARKSIETAQSNYRREFLPPPTREKSQHDPAAVAGAQALERLSHAIGALQGLITAQPMPENDRMMQRRRAEAETLQRLTASDQMLAGQAEVLRSMLDQKNGAWIIENATTLQEGINVIGETLRTRQLLLYPVN